MTERWQAYQGLSTVVVIHSLICIGYNCWLRQLGDFQLKHGGGFLKLCSSDMTECIEGIVIMKMDGESVGEMLLKERSVGV